MLTEEQAAQMLTEELDRSQIIVDPDALEMSTDTIGLSEENHVYDDMVVKFLEQFMLILDATAGEPDIRRRGQQGRLQHWPKCRLADHPAPEISSSP